MTNPIDQPAPAGQPHEPGQYAPAAPTAPPANAVPPSKTAPPSPPSASTPPSANTAPVPTVPAAGFDRKGRVRRTRVSGVWIGLIGAAVFLILLVVFIAQNSRKVPIHFFGWHGNFSLALTILVSAIVGVLLVALPGSIRIIQLRRALRKNVPGGTLPPKGAKAGKAKSGR